MDNIEWEKCVFKIMMKEEWAQTNRCSVINSENNTNS